MEHFQPQLLRTVFGMQSLVGVFGTPPLSYGNYFALDGYYVLNMWAGNLRHLLTTKGRLKNAQTLQVLASKVGKVCLVVDPRVPKVFRNDTLCFTGSGGYNQLSREGYAELYQWMDPNWNPAKGCFCERPNEFRSVYLTRWGGTERIGKCHICQREISQVVEAQPSGVIYLPYEMKTTTPVVEGELDERYTKKITGQYFTASTIDVAARLHELAAKQDSFTPPAND